MFKQPQRYFVTKIYEPEPESAYKWYVLERIGSAGDIAEREHVVGQYATRAMARKRCALFNSYEYQSITD